MLYRRFGYLQSRLLLEKQDDLRRLEYELDCMDAADVAEDEEVLRTRRYYREDDMKDRVDLMQRIEKKWLEYCMYDLASQVVSLLP